MRIYVLFYFITIMFNIDCFLGHFMKAISKISCFIIYCRHIRGFYYQIARSVPQYIIEWKASRRNIAAPPPERELLSCTEYSIE